MRQSSQASALAAPGRPRGRGRRGRSWRRTSRTSRASGATAWRRASRRGSAACRRRARCRPPAARRRPDSRPGGATPSAGTPEASPSSRPGAPRPRRGPPPDRARRVCRRAGHRPRLEVGRGAGAEARHGQPGWRGHEHLPHLGEHHTQRLPPRLPPVARSSRSGKAGASSSSDPDGNLLTATTLGLGQARQGNEVVADGVPGGQHAEARGPSLEDAPGSAGRRRGRSRWAPRRCGGARGCSPRPCRSPRGTRPGGGTGPRRGSRCRGSSLDRALGPVWPRTSGCRSPRT